MRRSFRVTFERDRPDGSGVERFTIPTMALTPDIAVRDASHACELRWRNARPVLLTEERRIMGYCRDCGETVFEGGQGRQRTTELRCYGCGGGP